VGSLTRSEPLKGPEKSGKKGVETGRGPLSTRPEQNGKEEGRKRRCIKRQLKISVVVKRGLLFSSESGAGKNSISEKEIKSQKEEQSSWTRRGLRHHLKTKKSQGFLLESLLERPSRKQKEVYKRLVKEGRSKDGGSGGGGRPRYQPVRDAEVLEAMKGILQLKEDFSLEDGGREREITARSQGPIQSRRDGTYLLGETGLCRGPEKK